MTDEADSPSPGVIVGRQGIYDDTGSVIGYELLFRGGPPSETSRDGEPDGDQKTAEVVYGALTIGLDQLVNDKRIFCNADRGVLLREVPLTLPVDRTVVEVLASVDLDDAVLAGCHELAAAGYTLAVDDFTWRPGIERLLPLVSIVKINVLNRTDDEIAELVGQCRPYDVTLLAERVEDVLAVDRLTAHGFELFQGYAFERPSMMSASTLEPDGANRLELARMLADDIDLEDLETVIRSDPALALQVFRLAAVGRLGETRRAVGSIREALVLSGTRQVKQWLTLLLARPVSSRNHAGYTSALVRAHACELLARRVSPALAQTGFAAGLLSSLDALLHVPAASLAGSLPLSVELRDAAFGGTGTVGLIVLDAVDYQLGRRGRRRSGLSEAAFKDAFARAGAWSNAGPIGLQRLRRRAG
jgi:c-di-GMP phosphodiesterase